MKQRSSENIALATPDCQKGDVAQPPGPPSVKIDPSIPAGSLEVLSTEMQPWLITKDWAGVWCVILNRNFHRPICVSHVRTLEHLGRVICATLSMDGNLIALGGEHSAKIFHLNRGNKIATFEDSNIFRQDYVAATRERQFRIVRFSSDAQLLLSAGDEGM